MNATVALRRSVRPSTKGQSGKKDRRKQKSGSADDSWARYEIVVAPLDSVGSPVFLDRELPDGGAKEYLSARKRGGRSFAMRTDPYRQRFWARVVTAAAAEGQPVEYEVYGSAGECVGRISRERAFSGGHIRTRWTVQQTGGPVAVGYKGRWFWWCVWWLISPLQFVLTVPAILGGGDLFRMPRRVRYFSGGAQVLDYGSGFKAHHLAAQVEGWEPRMLAALTALHSSHDGILGESWDTGRHEPPTAAADHPGAGNNTSTAVG